MNNDLSIVITLYETPIEKLKNLEQYKNYKIFILDQSKNSNFSLIEKIIGKKFYYYHSKKNLGLSKSTNILISKLETKYFLFTQADIIIENESILNLIKIIKKQNDVILAGPIFKKNNAQTYDFKNEYKYKSKLDASLLICNTEKVREIGFFDEDFFLYWEDIDLMHRINNSNFKMVQVLNSFANHEQEKSTKNNIWITFIRRINFKYGELIYDFKYNKLRKIKLFRQMIQNLVFLPFNIVIFKKLKIIENISIIIGIIKFFNFFFFKKK